MKTLTKQDIIDFINKQPNRRRVNFRQCLDVEENQCGCLMVHIYREFFPEYKGAVCAGFICVYGIYGSGIINTPYLQVDIDRIVAIKNYKQLKQNLHNLFID